MRELRKRWYGWWYLAISAGFALLALNGCLVSAPVSRIAMHCTFAAVFLIVAVITLRPRRE
jgi:hypothetical protein